MLSGATHITMFFARRIVTIADYIEGKCAVIAQEGKTKEKWEEVVEIEEECLQIKEEGVEMAVGLANKTVAQCSHVTTTIHDKEEIASKIKATIQKVSVASVHKR